MPDYVVYEFVKVMAENADRFVDFHPAGAAISLEYMPRWFGANETAYWHPGALQYYQEQNVDQYLGWRFTE